jgi:O-antigen/teichoic acid export membrane protein
VQIIGRIISTALGVVGVALIARYLGTAGYGHYSTVIAFLQLIAIVADLGLYLTLLQELGSTPENEHGWRFGSGLTLRLLTGAIVFALAPAVALLFPYSAEIKAGIALTAVGYWFNQIATLLGVVFQQRMKMAWAVAADTVGRIAFILAVWWAIHAQAGLMGILAANVLNSIVWVAILWVFARRLVPFKLHINWSHWKKILIVAWPIGLGIGLNLVYFKADTVVMSVVRPASEVGLYGAAYRVLEIVATVPHMIMGIALPLLAGLWASGKVDDLRNVLQKLFDLFWVMVWPILTGTMVIATGIMTLVAGADFTTAGPILGVLILAAGAIFFGTFFSYLVVLTGQQKSMLWIFGLVAILGCAAYILLIPRYTYWAAAWTTVAVELLVTLGAAWVARRKILWRPQWRTCSLAFLASLLMALIIKVSGVHNALVATILGIVVYTSLLLGLKIVPVSLIRQLMKPS